jgi:hypothetical protein
LVSSTPCEPRLMNMEKFGMGLAHIRKVTLGIFTCDVLEAMFEPLLKKEGSCADKHFSRSAVLMAL